MFKNLSIKKKIIIVLFIQFIILIILGLIRFLDVLTKQLGITPSYIILFLVFNGFSYYFLYNLVFKVLSTMNKNISTSQGEGDLTQRLPVYKKDEIGVFSRHFNIFIAKIHNIIFKLKNIIKNGNEIGEKLESSSVEIAASIEEMNANIQSINNNSRKLDDNVKSTQKDIIDIKKSIEDVVNSSETQNKSISESSGLIKLMIQSIFNINSISESKKELLGSLQERIINSEENMSKTIKSINNISQSANIIQEFIQVIENVSDQTNILAINAAIEAAHAGEFGKGFGVVAAEIRSLSLTTAENAKNISKNLNNIVLQIKDSLNLTNNTGQSIKKMTEDVQNVAASMNEIIEKVQEITSSNTKISTSLEKSISLADNVENSSKQIDEKAEKINLSIKDLVLITSQNTNALNEISVAMKEMAESITYISSLGVENVNNIDIIDENISRFNIIDTSVLKSSDGRPLIQWNPVLKKIPPRPDNPDLYPEDDERHWYDMEYAGWDAKKINIPIPPLMGQKAKQYIASSL